MNKSDLVEVLYEQQKKRGISKAAIKDFLESMTDQMAYMLKRYKKISHPALGVLQVKKRTKRLARNPRTGDMIEVEEKKHVVFRPSTRVKQKINES
ncbi:MAG TPA: HU family DNA-binding protein [Oligoflexia bacterium]|nr:HU family DNA-binding protein [Oligoflexia bacterium]HMR24880.1 HU family DNA-binding protein [Oligoflexia bacterium]